MEWHLLCNTDNGLKKIQYSPEIICTVPHPERLRKHLRHFKTASHPEPFPPLSTSVSVQPLFKSTGGVNPLQRGTRHHVSREMLFVLAIRCTCVARWHCYREHIMIHSSAVITKSHTHTRTQAHTHFNSKDIKTPVILKSSCTISIRHQANGKEAWLLQHKSCSPLSTTCSHTHTHTANGPAAFSGLL